MPQPDMQNISIYLTICDQLCNQGVRMLKDMICRCLSKECCDSCIIIEGKDSRTLYVRRKQIRITKPKLLGPLTGPCPCFECMAVEAMDGNDTKTG